MRKYNSMLDRLSELGFYRKKLIDLNAAGFGG